MRGAFGHHSQVYSHKLSDEQLDRWSLAAARVMTHPRLGEYGVMTPQQLYTSINSVRSRVNLSETLEPPAPVAFGPSVARELVIENTEAGVRLLLRIAGDLKEDVMVLGQEPCNSGRRKRRNVAYLGLLPPPINGLSDITYLYQARYGQPRPGKRVFIVTCQQKNGWKGIDREASALVPEPPKGHQATSEPENSQIPHMHKGSTRDAQGGGPPAASQSLEGTETGEGGEKAAGAAIGGVVDGGGTRNPPIGGEAAGETPAPL